MAERWRLFVALEVPRVAVAAIADAAESLRAQAPDARWTDPAGWHLTLVFLGNVPTGDVPAIGKAIDEVTAGHGPIDLSLSGEAGMFGRKVLWAAFDDSPALAALVAGLRAALAGYGPDDRPFHPHLTLARARAGGALPRDLPTRYEGPAWRWTARTVELIRSRLGRPKVRYTRILACPLSAAGDHGG